MQDFPKNKLQLAGIAALSLAFIISLFLAPPGVEFTRLFFEFGLDPILFLLIIFAVLFNLAGFAGKALTFTFTLALFYLPLLYKWQPADYYSALGGLLPMRDANEYYQGAQHEAFGFSRLGELLLEDETSRTLTRVARPLVLALHTREDPEPLDADLELEFILHDADGEFSAVARLSEFLRRHLPPLLSPRPGAVVLALCNPHRTVLPRPAALGDLPLWYGHGDVSASMRRRPGQRTWTPDTVDILLTADQWHRT